MTSRLLRGLCAGLLPLVLAACMSPEPAVASQPAATSVAVGVDLGGAPSRASMPRDHTTAMPATTSGMGHTMKPVEGNQAQLVHEGRADAHGTGTITAVNVAQRKIGLTHEPIPALGWPSMTMEFAVAPAVDLGTVKPGTKINFGIEKGADGMYVIQSLRPAGGAR
jgi:Cu(I)/Ag(I) efflux system protein CusF